jgi:hypothetical protein
VVAMPKSPFLIELGRLNDEDRQLMVRSRCEPDGVGAEVSKQLRIFFSNLSSKICGAKLIRHLDHLRHSPDVPVAVMWL